MKFSYNNRKRYVIIIISKAGQNTPKSVCYDLREGLAIKLEKGVTVMNKVSELNELLSNAKITDLLSKKEKEEKKSKALWVLAIVGAVAAVAVIAYGVYRFFIPDYLDDFEDDLEDDFEDDFFDDEETTEEEE